MTTRVLFVTALSFTAVSLFAQINHTGSVELLDASEDNTRVLFQVDGIAAKKGDVAQSARETVFHKLFYEGVEGINDEKPLVTKPKNYYVENFFSKKNPALNRFVILEELKGAINKNVDGQYVGTYELTMNLKALVNALNKAGATDNPVVWADPPQRRTVGIGAGKKDARPEQQPAQPAPKPAQEKPEPKPAQPQPAANPTPVAESAPAMVLISKDGVGPVRVGQNYTISEDVLNKSKLPDQYASLYDEITCDRDQFEGHFQIVCRLKDALSLLVFCDDNDKVECFTVVTDQAKTKEGLSRVSTAAQILAAGGKVENMPLKENNRTVGYLYRLVLNGVYFLFGNADIAGGKIKPDAKPYAISNTLFGGISEEELAIF